MIDPIKRGLLRLERIEGKVLPEIEQEPGGKAKQKQPGNGSAFQQIAPWRDNSWPFVGPRPGVFIFHSA